ncbi:MAG TPA: hypothetical protein VFW00_11680 [Rhodocyclaceae bacterium]|nr:hypothetical protein [Rhodocyclaceae bacterium]
MERSLSEQPGLDDEADKKRQRYRCKNYQHPHVALALLLVHFKFLASSIARNQC